jgi:hypothetical protein
MVSAPPSFNFNPTHGIEYSLVANPSPKYRYISRLAGNRELELYIDVGHFFLVRCGRHKNSFSPPELGALGH